jgi:hypothetical protein
MTVSLRCTNVMGIVTVGALTLTACGGEVVFPSEQEICEAGGADWGGVDCLGTGDHCVRDSVACETALGDGCLCITPGECWDGERCVYDPGLLIEVCIAAELFLYPSCADGDWLQGGCCSPDAGDACWDGKGCVPLSQPEG